MRTLHLDNRPLRWYERIEWEYNAAVPMWELRYWTGLWERYRWCLERLGLEYGWFDVREGYRYSAGRWAGVGEKFPAIQERRDAIRHRYGS